MQLSETCRCSGAFTVDTDSLVDAVWALERWRFAHPCDGKVPYGTASQLRTGLFELAAPDWPFGFQPPPARSDPAEP